MKKVLFVLFTVFIIVSFSGCILLNINGSDFNSVRGKGDPQKFEIRVGAYNGIRIEGFCNINYYAAPSNTVTLEIQPNLREYFIIEVEGGDLVVRTTRRISYNSGKVPVLTVSAPVLNRVNIDGGGNFTAHDKIISDSLSFTINGAVKGIAELDVNSTTVSLSGAGKMDLSGRSDTADFILSGAGELNALSLQTRDAKVKLSGAGKISLSCSDNLAVNAEGAGSVEYRGSPSVNMNTSGLVSIKKL